MYEWIRVTFGLTNTPAGFQWFMETCLFDIRDEFIFPYLDDVTVYSEGFRSHLDHPRIDVIVYSEDFRSHLIVLNFPENGKKIHILISILY